MIYLVSASHPFKDRRRDSSPNSLINIKFQFLVFIGLPETGTEGAFTHTEMNNITRCFSLPERRLTCQVLGYGDLP